MPLFRRVTGPAYGSSPIQAAAGAGNQVGAYYSYTVGSGVIRALQNPVINRAHAMLSSMIGALEIKHYTKQWTGEEYEEIYLPNEPWMDRPDPNNTANFFWANMFSDLYFWGRCFAWINTRSAADGRPTSFQWLPAAMIQTVDQAGPQYFSVSKQIRFNGIDLDYKDVVQVLSPIMGLIWAGQPALNIAERLDKSAERFAQNEIAAGYLQQRGGEPMSSSELHDLANSWAESRHYNSIGALNEFVEFVEFKADPSKLQLVEGRQYQDLCLSRLASIPPYLLGISVAGMTYANAQQARQDLYLFGAKPYIDALEQSFSLDTVLPRGRYIEFDVEDYINDAEMMPEVPVEPPVPTPTQTPSPVGNS